MLAYSSIAHAGYQRWWRSQRTTMKMDPANRSRRRYAAVLFTCLVIAGEVGALRLFGARQAASGTETLDDFAGLGTRQPFAPRHGLCSAFPAGMPITAGSSASSSVQGGHQCELDSGMAVLRDKHRDWRVLLSPRDYVVMYMREHKADCPCGS